MHCFFVLTLVGSVNFLSCICFFERYLGDTADIAGIIIGIVCDAPVVLTVLLAFSWISLFVIGFLITHRLKKIMMQLIEEVEIERARWNLDIE